MQPDWTFNALTNVLEVYDTRYRSAPTTTSRKSGASQSSSAALSLQNGVVSTSLPSTASG